MVTRPGSGSWGSAPKTSRLIQSARSLISLSVGRGFPAGGMMPARTFLSTDHQRFWFPSSASPEAKLSRTTFPFFVPSPWQR